MFTRLSVRLSHWIRTKRIQQLRIQEAKAKHELVTRCLGNVAMTKITNNYLASVRNQLVRLEAEQTRAEVTYGITP